MVEMVPVQSSNIRAVGYDHDRKEMHVEFGSGRYIYEGVPADAYQAMMAAESKGSHHHAEIKGKFKHRKGE